MDSARVQQFLRSLGCEKVSTGIDWVKSTCPLQHRHSGGRDKTPSFGVSISPKDLSRASCLACGYKGELLNLVWKMEAERGMYRPDLLHFIAQHNQPDPDSEPVPRPDDLHGQVRAVGEYVPAYARDSNFVHPDEEPQAEVPESVLQKMIADMPEYVMDYLTRQPDKLRGVQGRGLERICVIEWELGWHPLQGRICIPIRDEDGKLVAVSGRKYDEDQYGPKYLHSRFKRDRVLYGEHKRTDSRTGYLCEGFFHVLHLWQHGYMNPFARMGTHLSAKQADKLIRWLDRLVIVPDGDKAGKESAERIAESLVGRIPEVEIADMPPGKDVDDLDADQLREVLGEKTPA